MNNLVTILTVNQPEDLIFIRGEFDIQEIKYFVQDELTVQIIPFGTSAIGGVKLQVKEEDREIALKLLRDRGITPDGEGEIEASHFMAKFDKITSKLPLLKKTQLEVRFFIFIFILGAIFMGLLFAIFK